MPGRTCLECCAICPAIAVGHLASAFQRGAGCGLRDYDLGRRVMGKGRRAGDNDVGPCPWLLLCHERRFLGRPQVPERDGRLNAAVSFYAPPLRFGHVGLHPDHGVGHGPQLAPGCPGTFDDHQVASLSTLMATPVRCHVMDTWTMEAKRAQLFISYAGSNRDWAEWVAWQLADAGYAVEFDAWDWKPGQNLILAMSDALDRCESVVALYSRAYFERQRYTTDEWTAATLHVAKLIPLRVEDISIDVIPAILRSLKFADLFGVPEDNARHTLLDAVSKNRSSSVSKPLFPTSPRSGPGGSDAAVQRITPPPKLPTQWPRIWNVEVRSPTFTGRDQMLLQMRETFIASEVKVLALYGIGGVGKTQLANEYAHRFARTYDLVWWISANEPTLIAVPFAALGAELGIDALAETGAVRTAVLHELRDRPHWLLIFDNAVDPADLRHWLPSGVGHVLITSRELDWDEVAVPMEVDVLTRADSVAILRRRVASLNEEEANKLAAHVGDLPLGLAQAAGFIKKTGMPVSEYLTQLQNKAMEVMGAAPPINYPETLAGAIRIQYDNLARDDSSAAAIARLCAFLASTPISREMFMLARSELPPSLADLAADPLKWRLMASRLVDSSLARIDGAQLLFHPLTQNILRDMPTGFSNAETRAQVDAIIATNNPGDPENSTNWPQWSFLMPHLLAAEPAKTTNLKLRSTTKDGCLYLLACGDFKGANELLAHLVKSWIGLLGQDDDDTVAIVNYRLRALVSLEDYAVAKNLADEAFRHRTEVFGRDNAETLTAASYLAVSLLKLGERERARALDEDTWARRRSLLGDDHPATMISANNLAIDLAELGDVRGAAELGKETLARRRRLLGEDHPNSLASATNLVGDLAALHELSDARLLAEDTLARQSRVEGEDHPDTLKTATNLANVLTELAGSLSSEPEKTQLLRRARDLTRNALERQRRILGPHQLATLVTAMNLSEIIFAFGKVEEAIDLAEDAHSALQIKYPGEENFYTLAVKSLLGKYRAAQGDPQD
jgi:TIR domain/Tetratricopeptide repeat/NB-ARC domain